MPGVEIQGELGIDHEVWEARVFLEGLVDLVQQAGANDAPSLPDPGTLGEINVPVLFVGSCADDVHSLRVAAYLAGVKRRAQIVDDLGGSERAKKL